MKTRPKWYEKTMMADAPVMKKDKMMHMDDCLDEDMMAEAPVMKKDKMMYMDDCVDEDMNGDMDCEMNGHMDCEMDGHMDCEMGNMDNMHMPQGKAMPMPIVLAHAYVPWQFYDRAFCPREALMKGTLFPELWGVYPIPE